MNTHAVMLGTVLFALGVAHETIISFGWSFGILCAVLGAGGFVFYTWTKEKGYATVAVLFIAFGIGIVRTDMVRSPLPQMMETRVETKTTVEGVVVREPDIRQDSARFTISIKRMRTEDGWVSIEGSTRLLAAFPRYTPFQYGDKVRISGTLKKPEDFIGDNGREFKYVGFLAKDDVHYLMYYPHGEHISSGHGNVVRERLYAAKKAFLVQIGRMIPEPQASLLGGLLVGERRALGEETLDQFRAAGLIHVIVLSGYHVTIVADSIMRVLAFLPRMAGFLLGAGGIVLFALLTMGATVIRASSMALLVLFARATGRTTDTLRILFLVGAAMVFWNPLILLYDPSFQLSFTATLGLLVLSEKVKEWIAFIPEIFNLRDIASATISTQIFLLPLLLYMMGDLSLVSVPANLLVIVFIPFTMLFGFLAGVLGFVSASLASFPAFFANALLSYTLQVVHFAADLPLASVTIPAFSLGMLVMAYGCLGAWLYARRGELRTLRHKRADTGKIGAWKY